jgi:protocatechuate 3,4-dioxygenase beta subunit
VAQYKVKHLGEFSLRRSFGTMRSAFRAIFPVLVLLCAISTSAQNSDDSQNKCSLHGTVVDSKTGQPIKGAEITLRGGWTTGPGSRTSGSGASEPTSATSDSDGHFSLDGLAPGRYRVIASRNGYLGNNARSSAGSRATMVNLSVGQQSDITLRLTPSAVIAGRVTTEGDEPAPNVFVQAMKYNYMNDKRQLTDVGSATTNDRGEYRIWGLAPGKYYVRATHPRAQAARAGGQVFVPMFYPNVTDPSRTQPIDLHPGDEVTGIDLGLVAQRSVRVSGRVVNSNGQPDKGAQVTLVAGTGSMSFSVGQASTDAKGIFEIRGVPPGSYTVLGEQFGNADSDKVMRGRTSLEVGETNVADVEVATGPGSTVTGHVRVDGKSNPDLTKMSVTLDSQDDLASLGFAPDVSNVAVRADGSFVFQNVPEGTYRINVVPLPNGFYLKPSGEGDAVETGVKVGHNRSVAVELTLSAGAGRVSGNVTKDDHAFPGATVVLVPDAPRRGQPRFYRQALTDQSGNFSIANITPGDYKLFAWEEVERGMYLDPDFMQSYEDSGKSVHVDEGGNASAQLELIQTAGD